ncbi:LexA family transcriptional regulator [Peptostreptococcus faecalis]|uniref:LexA family transcriptional regulator n=1 Tax=Peptostreptococcus faecalis TaxID=2045015 RepID=UPI000C7971E4|nr:LexA family transcriptional regulator [Peptostreptococcus faecalis]
MNKIKHYRLENNYSQEDLAKLLNVSRSTIVRYENMSDNEIPQNISTYQLKLLCKILNIDIDFFIKFKESNIKSLNIYNLKNRKMVTSYENFKDYVLIHKNKVDSDYVVKIESEDNINFNIFPNYFVLVKNTQKYTNGDLIVISIDNENPVIRKCYIDKNDEDKIILLSGNSKIEVLSILKKSVSVLGKITGVYFQT